MQGKMLAQTFKALSDETRLLCLALLFVEKELCVCDLEIALGISQSKTSRHLRYLLNAGLVTDRREGLWVYYRIAQTLTLEQRVILNAISGFDQCDFLPAALVRLNDFRKSDRERVAKSC